MLKSAAPAQDMEDLEDEGGLAAMHTSVRGAIMLNDTGLLEAMLAEQNVMDVIGALECDPYVTLIHPYVMMCWHRPPEGPPSLHMAVT